MSTGLYASLNCGPGSRDDAAAVTENRRRVAEALAPGAALVEPVPDSQSHRAHAGPRARAVARRRCHGHRHPGLGLGILTADCAPVLLADAQGAGDRRGPCRLEGRAGRCAGSHAWRRWKNSAPTGRASPPPSAPASARRITKSGWDFRDRFLELGLRNRKFFIPSDKEGHYRFDLEDYAAQRLDRGGRGQRGKARRLHLSARKRLFQLPPHHPCGRAGLWPPGPPRSCFLT